MSEDKEKKIHANEESGDEVEAHQRTHRHGNDEGGTDKSDDDSNDVEAHVRTHRN